MGDAKGASETSSRTGRLFEGSVGALQSHTVEFSLKGRANTHPSQGGIF
jgi:hypothetical protein